MLLNIALGFVHSLSMVAQIQIFIERSLIALTLDHKAGEMKISSSLFFCCMPKDFSRPRIGRLRVYFIGLSWDFPKMKSYRTDAYWATTYHSYPNSSTYSLLNLILKSHKAQELLNLTMPWFRAAILRNGRSRNCPATNL